MSNNTIRDVEKLHQRQIETSKRRIERELKNMDAAHREYKADLKKTNDLDVVDLQKVHQDQISEAQLRKEKILEGLREHLEQSKRLTEKELKNLKDSSQKEKVDIQQKYSADRERIKGEHELYLEDMNGRFNQSGRKIAHDGKMRVEELKTQKNDEYLDVERRGQDKIDKQTEEFLKRYRHDEKNYKSVKDTQGSQFKKERLSTNLKQQTELKKMSETHQRNFETHDTEYRKGLKDQELFFEKKYTGQLKRHNDEFKSLEAKNEKVVEDLKASLTKEITKTASRNEDPFYRFDSLKPRLKTFEDRVEIEVDIPEHSKQDVQLSLNGKEAIVMFNRRYSDASKMEDGTINKINKVETFTTRLQTPHFLNGKSLKSHYENGVMTYVIKKS